MEEWKTVVYKGETYDDYEVSNLGRVRSLGNDKSRKTKILSQTENGCKYLKVGLSKNGKVKTFKVHILVAWAWIPNPDNKPTVNHINENKHDNRVENLEWATMSEQQRHGTCGERKAKKRGRKVYCVELDKTFDSISEAERLIGVKSINKACRGKQKTSGGYHWKYV